MATTRDLIKIVIAGAFFVVLGGIIVAAIAAASARHLDTDWIYGFGIDSVALDLIAFGLFGIVVAAALIAYRTAGLGSATNEEDGRGE